MSDTITIADRDAFPKKVEAIRHAAANLREFGTKLEAIVTKARDEAKSLTTNGRPAPIYQTALDALGSWHSAASAASAAVCDSADNCVTTMSDKFNKITGADNGAAKDIVSS